MNNIGTNAVFILWTPQGRTAIDDLVTSGFHRSDRGEATLRYAAKGDDDIYDVLTARTHDKGYLESPSNNGWLEQLFESEWGLRSPDSALSVFNRHEHRPAQATPLHESQVKKVFAPLQTEGYGILVVRGHYRIAEKDKAEDVRAQVEMGMFVMSTPNKMQAYRP